MTNQGGRHRVPPHFKISGSAPKLLETLLFVFQNGEKLFSCGHPFGLFLSVNTSILGKICQFGQPIRLLEKVETPPFCPPRGAKKKVSAHGLILVCRSVYIHYFKINPPFSVPFSFLKIISTFRSGLTKW